MSGAGPRVLIIGGQFSGNFVARDLKRHFNVTVVDAKEYFEYTPGILRAFVKPAHFDALSFTLQPVFERIFGVGFIWGEVKSLDGVQKTATIKTMFCKGDDLIDWDYCICCSGCNFGVLKPKGESHWFPTVHEVGREISDWPHIDERFIEGRRRHILEEYQKIKDLERKKAKVLVVGAGFIGVEWATELEHYFPNLNITIIDFLPKCLGPLPAGAATYCSKYMHAHGIKEFYNTKYDAKDQEFWKKVELPDGADETYACLGVKASNYFMPPEVLCDPGKPGGPGWICVNIHLQVVQKPGGPLWGDGSVFAVGDCNNTSQGMGEPPNWVLPPIPKISYPGEEQALHACKNIERLDKARKSNEEPKLGKTWWPWGAGMFATSLGPHDACFVLAANHNKNSGYMVNWWFPAALQKEIIETTKVDECRGQIIGTLIWHFVHHTPIHLWGEAPRWGI